MAQHDFTIDNQTFPSTRSDINSALQALASLSSGASAPSTTFAYQLWVNTTSDPNILNIRNSANNAWVEIGEVNQSSAAFILTTYAYLQAGAAANPSFSFDDDRDTGMYRAAANMIGFATNGTERVRINDAGQTEFTAGTAALPAIATTGDTNTGMLFPAADTVAISTGGTERVRVTSTGVGLNGSTSGTLTIAAPAVAGTNTITFPAATDTVVGIAATQTLTNKTLTGTVFSAGTTSVSPVNLTSGTNLTTATAGAIEYDGKVFYGTPQSTQRGIVPGQQFYRLNANLLRLDSTAVQSILGVGVTLSASTVYAFQFFYIFTRSGGASTSHTFSLLYGGTATLNNILYTVARDQDTALPGGGQPLIYGTNVATATIIDTSSTTSTTQIQFGHGTVSINAGGTFIPQFQLSATNSAAYSTLAGSYFLIYPIGASGSNTSVGAWA